MEDEVEYEALSSNAGVGANMLAGALVSHKYSVHNLPVLPMLPRML